MFCWDGLAVSGDGIRRRVEKGNGVDFERRRGVDGVERRRVEKGNEVDFGGGAG